MSARIRWVLQRLFLALAMALWFAVCASPYQPFWRTTGLSLVGLFACYGLWRLLCWTYAKRP